MESVQIAAISLLVLMVVAILVMVCLTYTQNSKTSSYKGPQFAVLCNQVGATNPGTIQWAATQADNYSCGISLDPTSGTVILPNGKYLVQYSVRVQRTPVVGTSTTTLQLQQTDGGVMQNITEPAVVSLVNQDSVVYYVPSTPEVITGNAVITVTSKQNNSISLYFNPGPGVILQSAGGSDANAQLVIKQLA